MTLDARFAGARVARLATVRADGGPHLVPIVFACDDDTVYTAVDGKPKAHTRLARLANIAAEPRVCLIADGYDEDWAQLWWVRVDGEATVHEDDDTAATGLELLRAKYPQYRDVSVGPVVIAVAVHHVASWPSR